MNTADRYYNHLTFIRRIARMPMDGEEVNGDTVVMDPDDAESTLGELIEAARALLNEEDV